MAIRDRITQLITIFVRQIYASQGGVLLGRETGSGIVEEITIGSGLTLSAGVLTAAGGDSVSGASVSDSAYTSGWNGVTTIAPSKNAVYDKFEDLDASKQPLSGILTNTTASFTTVLESKLSGIEAGAQVNVPLAASLTSYAADPAAAILANLPAPLALTTVPVNPVDTLAITGDLAFDGDSLVFPTLYKDTSETDGTHWKDIASLGLAADYAAFGSSGAWSLFALGSVMFTSSSAVATPDLAVAWTPRELASETGLDITRTFVAGTTGAIGQTAIVTHSGGSKTEWGAVSLTEWLPRTAGIIKHANGDWYRQTLAADGTAEYNILPNQ